MSEIIPFGKYKGHPLEVLMQDKQYLDWLQSQEWFKSRYQTINTLIINNFTEPSETPEHNKLQALFTDIDFCIKCFFVVFNNEEDFLKARYFKEGEFVYYDLDSYEIKPFPYFEINSIDVSLKFEIKAMVKGFPYNSLKVIDIELKPSIGDDYPAILRQMHNNKAKVLITEKYVGVGATFEQVKKMFSASGIRIILLSEIV